MISVAFFGTHQFACTILQALLDHDDITVAFVITQPDKPVGRRKILTPPPVKIIAEQAGITIFQPPTLKNFMLPEPVDVNIVAQYGKLIPVSLLDAPKHATLNVHTSMLPKYRGASPIQSALINGDHETGVTIMKMDEGLDTGPILLQQSLAIDPDETYLELDARLAATGAQVLLTALPLYINGTLVPEPQNDDEATHCRQLTREDGHINWNSSAEEIYNLYRGTKPWPGVWTTIDGKRLKILGMTMTQTQATESPGVVTIEKDGAFVHTLNKRLHLILIQLDGKNPRDAAHFFASSQGLIQFI